MKRLFSYLLLLAAITAACSDNTDEIYTPGDDIEGSNDRYLVVYCSRTGNTAEMAQTIQSALACDMITVNPETPYDENYNAMLERADYVGCVSGAKVDKSQVFTYHLGEAGTPVIDESPLVMECEVVDNYETEDFDNFICKIANTYAEENILNDKGNG